MGEGKTMNTSHNTVLITGGSAGIGLAVAKVLTAKGNHVIITGRDKERLNKAAAELSNATAIQFDVTSNKDVDALVTRVKNDFPNLNILINNAGRAFVYNLDENADAAEKATEEMITNYFSVIRLTEKLLPVLKQQPEAAIVNVSSIVAFAGRYTLPTYAASKAALHSYTNSLRIQLERTSNIKVFELMPPLVNTELAKPIGGEQNGIPPHVVAEDLLQSLESNNYEIHVGNTANLYRLFLSSPAEALKMMKPVDEQAEA